jgi:predicted Zn-dependent peptidase
MTFDLKLIDTEGIFLNKKFTNGCQVLMEKLPWFLSTSIGIWIKVGSKYESKTERGMSHLIEHLLFRGSKNRSAQEITDYIELVGGEINACTERELTCYSVKVLHDDVLRGIELLYDLVTNPLFNEEHIAKEKEIVLREVEEHEEDYHSCVHDLLIENMISGPLGYPIYGDKTTLNIINKKQIEHFYNQYYIPENMVISIAGNFNEDEALQHILKTFGSLSRQNSIKKRTSNHMKKSEMVIKDENVEQIYFCLGIEGLKQTDNDRVAMYVISSILGEGMGSRLYKKVREEAGLAYTIYTYYTLYNELGTFIITGVTTTGNLKPIVEIVKNETKDLYQRRVPEKELAMAKAKLKGNYYSNLEQVVNRMIRIAKLNDWHNRHFTIDEEVQMIEQVTVEDVMRVSKRLFFHDKWSLAIIGSGLSTSKKGELQL